MPGIPQAQRRNTLAKQRVPTVCARTVATLLMIVGHAIDILTISLWHPILGCAFKIRIFVNLIKVQLWLGQYLQIKEFVVVIIDRSYHWEFSFSS